MTSSRSLRTMACAGIVGLALSACGGGGGSSGLGATALRKSLNSICETMKSKVDALTEPASINEAADYFADVERVSKAGMSEMQDLEAADKKDASALDDMIRALDRSHGDIEDMIAAAKNQDDDAGQKASDAYDTHIARFTDAAGELGADSCVNVGDTEASDATEPPMGTEAPADTEAPMDTATPETLPPASTATVSVPPLVLPTEPVNNNPAPADTLADTGAAGAVAVADLGTFINPPAGYDVTPAPDDQLQGMVDELNADPAAASYVQAVGGGVATDAAGTNVVIGLKLSHALTPDEVQQFTDGVVGTAADYQQTNLSGVDGVEFLNEDGSFGFTAVVGDIAFIVISGTAEQLQAIMDALVAANQ